MKATARSHPLEINPSPPLPASSRSSSSPLQMGLTVASTAGALSGHASRWGLVLSECHPRVSVEMSQTCSRAIFVTFLLGVHIYRLLDWALRQLLQLTSQMGWPSSSQNLISHMMSDFNHPANSENSSERFLGTVPFQKHVVGVNGGGQGREREFSLEPWPWGGRNEPFPCHVPIPPMPKVS